MPMGSACDHIQTVTSTQYTVYVLFCTKRDVSADRVEVKTNIGIKTIPIPKSAKAAAASEYAEQWHASERKALDVILSIAKNKLVPLSVARAKGVKPTSWSQIDVSKSTRQQARWLLSI